MFVFYYFFPFEIKKILYKKQSSKAFYFSYKTKKQLEVLIYCSRKHSFPCYYSGALNGSNFVRQASSLQFIRFGRRRKRRQQAKRKFCNHQIFANSGDESGKTESGKVCTQSTARDLIESDKFCVSKEKSSFILLPSKFANANQS